MYDVCVVGSLNMDMVVNVDRIPNIGETVLANGFKKIPGGKGANQAVAARRMGSSVVMVGCVGDDENGRILIDNLDKDGIDTAYIKKDLETPTGIALIYVDKEGRNNISVYPGANLQINKEDVNKLNSIIESKVVITQFETPVETAIESFKLAKKNKRITILNPAPARQIPDELIQLSDIIIPNETETEVITGIKPIDEKSIKDAADIMLHKGAKYVIITLGEKGAAIVNKEKFVIVEAYKVNAVDTTAAGDSFIGGLAHYISKKDNLSFDILQDAVKFANKVSAIAVTREGAQSSIPYMWELKQIFGEELIWKRLEY